MTDPTARNRLDEEESPYLRQHADNPVNWQPWDEDALEAARERDVPIFLSVGYSACHWCHVMEDESFQDEEVAALLNEDFVPIKVDREERPDVDSVYQTVVQLVSGRGGWPLSAWLTPEGKPFFVGTYFPREGRQGQPGFRDLLERLASSWRDDRDAIEERAEEWTRAARDNLEETPDSPGEAPDAEVLLAAADAAVRSADREHGGFGRGGPKFPHPGRIDLLLRAYAEAGHDEALRVAVETLDAMATGGMYDHVGGGFHRYATDRQWTVPHFEKMLYDNAELPRVYLAAHQLTGEERYARVARETLDFVSRELGHPEGGFYSTLDAQSEGEEGKFYVWTPEGVREAIGDGTTADLACDRFGVTSGGNFEGGRTVLTVSATHDDLAEEYDLSVEEVTERLADAREALFEAREGRVRPARDEKIIGAWNGLMVSAFAAGARVLDEKYADAAEDALGFVREHLWDEDEGRLARRFKDVDEPQSSASETESRAGDVKGTGYLDDYAFLGRGALDLYQVTGDVEHLAFALELGRTVEEEFWDADRGTLYYTPRSGESLVTRPQELRDQSTPSSLGVATGFLADLSAFAPDAGFGGVVDRVLSTHADAVRGSPLEHVSLALAAAERDAGSLELTLAADEVPDEWRATLAERYLPGALVSPRPPTDEELAPWLDALGLDEAPPVWAGREARDGRPTAYACESFTCSPPRRDLTEALDWFDAEERETLDADAFGGADDGIDLPDDV